MLNNFFHQQAIEGQSKRPNAKKIDDFFYCSAPKTKNEKQTNKAAMPFPEKDETKAQQIKKN